MEKFDFYSMKLGERQILNEENTECGTSVMQTDVVRVPGGVLFRTIRTKSGAIATNFVPIEKVAVDRFVGGQGL